MAVYVDVDESFTVGQAWFASVSSDGTWAVVFEDDGVTAYLYASTWDSTGEGTFGPVMDAMHVYNVADIKGADKPSRSRSAGTPVARRRPAHQRQHPSHIRSHKGASCCRTGFPPSPAESPFRRHLGWDPSLEAGHKQ